MSKDISFSEIEDILLITLGIGVGVADLLFLWVFTQMRPIMMGVIVGSLALYVSLFAVIWGVEKFVRIPDPLRAILLKIMLVALILWGVPAVINVSLSTVPNLVGRVIGIE